MAAVADQKTRRRREVVASWRDAYERGIAGELCVPVVLARPGEHDQVLLAVVEAAPAPPYIERRPRPTEAEADLIRLLAAGLTTKEAAAKVGCSYQAAVNRLARARRRSGVRALEELLAIYDAPYSRATLDDLVAPAPAPIVGRDGRLVRKPSHVQLEVIRLYADGLSLPEVSERLWLGESAVRNRVQKALVRTGARNMPHLVALSIRRRWIA